MSEENTKRIYVSIVFIVSVLILGFGFIALTSILDPDIALFALSFGVILSILGLLVAIVIPYVFLVMLCTIR